MAKIYNEFEYPSFQVEIENNYFANTIKITVSTINKDRARLQMGTMVTAFANQDIIDYEISSMKAALIAKIDLQTERNLPLYDSTGERVWF